MKALLGLDYGAKRIGIAICPPGGRFAVPHSVIKHLGWGPSARAIKELATAQGAEAVILGLPRNMDGSLGFQAKEVQGFAQVLETLGLTVYFQDERLSSFEAEERLAQTGLNARQIKDKVDQTAAAIILQEWLDSTQDKG